VLLAGEDILVLAALTSRRVQRWELPNNGFPGISYPPANPCGFLPNEHHRGCWGPLPQFFASNSIICHTTNPIDNAKRVLLRSTCRILSGCAEQHCSNQRYPIPHLNLLYWLVFTFPDKGHHQLNPIDLYSASYCQFDPEHKRDTYPLSK
jgi:hypothetical protein